ncbi:MAG TPA: CAAX prenyl protease-related protein [Bryobacteraceae bacterium]|nr:CAAX prenyl protease-related protein [Bryobacteraceae bacterium]
MNFRHPAVPYVLPFAVFIAVLALQAVAPVPVSVRLVLSLAAIAAVSLPVLRAAPTKPLLSILLGIAAFFVWVGPDVLVPGWHHLLLFDNPITGHPVGNTAPASKNDAVFLFLRIAISVIAVPILEELFWRGWLMRWLIDSGDFTRVPLGAYTPQAFWLVAAIFAVEHGSFWDVGFVTGIIFNWWMVRTRNLWDCILMHAATNAALAAYVVIGGHWQYWL